MKPNPTNNLDDILDAKPDLVPPPDGLWESIYATWTGLWTDFHGEWDERQASDVFPISDLLSEERKAWFKASINQWALQEVLDLIDSSFTWFWKDEAGNLLEVTGIDKLRKAALERFGVEK